MFSELLYLYYSETFWVDGDSITLIHDDWVVDENGKFYLATHLWNIIWRPPRFEPIKPENRTKYMALGPSSRKALLCIILYHFSFNFFIN